MGKGSKGEFGELKKRMKTFTFLTFSELFHFFCSIRLLLFWQLTRDDVSRIDERDNGGAKIGWAECLFINS